MRQYEICELGRYTAVVKLDKQCETQHSPKNQTSEQHVELGASRCNRDFVDLMVFYNWFEKFDPFDTTNS